MQRTGRNTLVVIPCYNESRRLQTDAIRRFAKTCNVGIIFVDDGSRDNTRQVLESLKLECPEAIEVLVMPVNRGKAEAVRFGMRFAMRQNAAFVGYWDADLATPLSAIGDFLEVFEMRPEIEMVFGSRVKLLGRDIKRRAVRHYLGRIFATTVSTMLRLPVYDTQCGAKLFRLTGRTCNLFKEEFLSRWVFDVELIARYISVLGSAEAAAKRIYEYPLHRWSDIAGSKVKPRDFCIAFWDVVRIRSKYLRRNVEWRTRTAHW